MIADDEVKRLLGSILASGRSWTIPAQPDYFDAFDTAEIAR